MQSRAVDHIVKGCRIPVFLMAVLKPRRHSRHFNICCSHAALNYVSDLAAAPAAASKNIVQGQNRPGNGFLRPPKPVWGV